MISRRTTKERLLAEVASRDDGPLLVVGTGARGRRLRDWLCQEVPGFVPGESSDDREHVAIRHDGSLTAIAWHRDGSGKAPAFELNPLSDPQGMFRNR